MLVIQETEGVREHTVYVHLDTDHAVRSDTQNIWIRPHLIQLSWTYSGSAGWLLKVIKIQGRKVLARTGELSKDSRPYEVKYHPTATSSTSQTSWVPSLPPSTRLPFLPSWVLELTVRYIPK